MIIIKKRSIVGQKPSKLSSVECTSWG